ncbi:DUF2235 domain-containing protein [Roseibium denhamense]|uniref:Uncharacterized protein, PA2063/DUF2235 family n=1 Tax=Roseibium denhamense TaxID=76305 RepID=A0ABY1NPB6_9HYPH|nr:DUF2235 domain-containing protein [Roseibium denhamense]SMP14334.1 Uncharacterized protein, PA2063/DUF2235 family [Roseibium denhamense]
MAGKKLVILCDGTWQTEDQEYPTNVAHFYRALYKRDEHSDLQLAHYDEGVGTSGFIDRLLGGAFGVGLSKNVKDAYRFLIEHYNPGDKIYLLGFSRGAFTARSIGGLIGAVGIIDRAKVDKGSSLLRHLGVVESYDEVIDEAYEYYRTRPGDRPPIAETNLAECVHPNIEIEFVGVWDTVGSLGIPILDEAALINRKFQFHDVELGRNVKHAYHAVAIDEQRGAFSPTLWKKGINSPAGQTIEQVWFAGAHGGVGGGKKVDGLSNITFHWMCSKAVKHGIALEWDYVGHQDRKPNLMDPVENDLKGVYRRLPLFKRTVLADGYVGQSVHPTVDEKLEKDPGYRPDNYRGVRKAAE